MTASQPAPGQDPTTIAARLRRFASIPFVRALRYCKPYWMLILGAWLCAFMSIGCFVGSIGAAGPIIGLLFEEPAKTVRYIQAATPTPEDPEHKEWQLEVSKHWKIVEDPEVKSFEVQGETVRVNPSLTVMRTQEGLSSIARKAESSHQFYAPFLRAVASVLPTDRYYCLVWIMVAVIIMTILRGVFRYTNEYLVGYATNRAMLALRLRVYDHVLRSPLSVFTKTGPSDMISRFQNDTFLIHEGMKMLLGKVISEPFRLVACLAVAVGIGIGIDPWLPVIVLVAGPIIGFLVKRLAKQMRKASRKALESWAALVGILEETLFGIRIVKGYRLEGHVRKKFFGTGRRLFRQVLKSIRIDASTEPLVETIFTIVASAAVLVAGKIMLDRNLGQQGIQDITLFFAFLVGALDPARKLTNVSNRMQQAAAGSERLFALLDNEMEPRYGTRGTDLPRLKTSVEFRDVSFTYPTGGEVLSKINLLIRHDEVLAIVGRTGCGKTTLVSLLPRFFTPTSGTIFIDGTNIQDVTLRSLRNQIAIVPQETVLFADTVAQNIALGSVALRGRAMTRDDIEAAAKAAHADAFIRNLPQGYDTVISERGSSLSGGERQRLALARAIIRNPALLVLDEATSSLDEETQALVQDTLKTFTQGRTTILIAHRLSTLAIADRIVVMDAGRIVGIGTHDELMQSCALYRRLREVGLDSA